MPVFKTILKFLMYTLLAIIGLISLIAVWFYLDFYHISPFLHARNTERADQMNDQYWEEGVAYVITLESSVETSQKRHVASEEIICVPKSVTRGKSLKGGKYFIKAVSEPNRRPEYFVRFDIDGLPYTHARTGSDLIEREISPSQSLRWDRHLSCKSIWDQLDDETVPFRINSLAEFSIVSRSAPLLLCKVVNIRESKSVENFTINPTSVVAVRAVRLKETLTREQYGPADVVVFRQQARQLSFPQRAPSYLDNNIYWYDETSCWRAARSDICHQAAFNRCTPME